MTSSSVFSLDCCLISLQSSVIGLHRENHDPAGLPYRFSTYTFDFCRCFIVIFMHWGISKSIDLTMYNSMGVNLVNTQNKIIDFSVPQLYLD